MNAAQSAQSLSVNSAPGKVSAKARVVRAIARLVVGVTRPLAGRRFFPLWGIVHHVGRTSGRAYATPVAVRRTADGFLIPIPFGEATQWVRNVSAAAESHLTWQGGDHVIADPRVVEWPDPRSDYDLPTRIMVPILGIRHFLRVREVASR